MIGATNTLPDDPGLRAFADRFTMRLTVEPVSEEHMESLLVHGWELESERVRNAKRRAKGEVTSSAPILKLDDLHDLHASLADVELKEVRPILGQIVKEARASGVAISDRRLLRGLKLISGAARLRGEDAATAVDLWPIRYLWTHPEEEQILRDLVEPKMAEAGGTVSYAARGAETLELELRQLEGDVPTLRSEAALGAHLQRLNRLRLEILKDHRGNEPLKRGVESVIDGLMEQIGG
jgi:MoxR-like ATPase